MPILRSEVRELPVALGDSELLDRHQALVAVIDDIEHEEGDLSTIKQQYKAKREELESERDRLLKIVRERKEPREVVVNLVLDIAAQQVSEVRDDTGEVVLVRGPYDDERQMSMFGNEPSDTDAPAVPPRRRGRKRVAAEEPPAEAAADADASDPFADTPASNEPASNESTPPSDDAPSVEDETPW